MNSTIAFQALFDARSINNGSDESSRATAATSGGEGKATYQRFQRRPKARRRNGTFLMLMKGLSVFLELVSVSRPHQGKGWDGRLIF